MKKSVVLVLACMVSVVLLILTAGFTAGVVNEKLFMEKEKGVLQAVNLAEAGLNCGIGELRNQINSRITTALQSSTNNIDASDYIDSTRKDSLDFLCDVLGYTFVNSDSDEVSKAFSPSSSAVLNTGINGNYSGKVIVRKQRDETDQPIEGYISSGKYIFPYEFIVEATGASRGTTKTLRYLGGEFNINVVQDTFARYALFTNQNKTGPNGSIVFFSPTTKFTGPVHTNGNCNFLGNPAGVFTENVTQQDQKAYFYGHGDYDEDSYGNVVPQFEKSFTRGAANINLQSSVNTNDLAKQALGTMKNPGHNGIYLPSSGSGAKVSLTGGIYIQGNAKVSLGASGDNAVYSISQDATRIVTTQQTTMQSVRECTSGGYQWNNCCYGRGVSCVGCDKYVSQSCEWVSKPVITEVIKNVSGIETKDIVVNYVNNQTTVKTTFISGTVTKETSETFSGIPNGSSKEGVIIYADGQITDLRGTVQKDSQVMVSAKNDIVIGNHIQYEQYSGSGTALTAQGYTNTLGIVSCNGNVRIGTSTPSSGDLDVHATVMAPKGVFTVDNYNSRIIGGAGKVNLLGGVITDYYGAFGQYDGSETAFTAQGYTNTPGIVSYNGNNVRISTSTPSSGDLDVHATVMAPNGVFTVDNYDNRIIDDAGKVNLLGEVITNYYGASGTVSGTGYGQNFVYDQRMLGLTRPPYFPTLDTFKATSTELEADISDMALIWQEQ